MKTDQGGMRVWVGRRAGWLLLAAGLVVGVQAVRGQIDPASTAVEHPVEGAEDASAAPGMKFDVVSVRLDRSSADGASIESPVGGDGITIRNLALEWIIDFAYDFQRPELVSGLPDWARSGGERWDIAAKVSDEKVAAFRKLNMAQRREMLQALLEEQFQLRVRREPKEMPVYALVVGKGGVKMKPAAKGDTYANGPKYPNGSPAGAGTLTPSGGGIVGQAAQMQQLSLMLSKVALGREVLDETGLTGRYDFTLHFAPTEVMRPVINGQMTPLSAEDEAQPSVFTAVEEQLGLRLVNKKEAVVGLVVDHVEQPSEN